MSKRILDFQYYSTAKVEHEVEMSVGVDEKRKVAEEYIRGLFNNDTGNSTEENN